MAVSATGEGTAVQNPLAVGHAAGPHLTDTDLLGIIRVLPDVIFRCERHADGKIYFSLNEGRLAEEFHVTTAEIEGVPLDELFPGGASATIMDHFERAFEGDEAEFLNEMGGRWFKHHPTPVRDERGRVAAVVGFITEVTELKRMQEHVQHLTTDLTKRLIEKAEATKNLEAFSYSLSHDLRTPMSVIAAQNAVLRRTLPADSPKRLTAGLDRMEAAVRRMNGMIDDMLALSQATRAPLRLGDVDVSHLANDLVADLRATSPERDVTVDVEPGIHAHGDENLLRQVFQNLIGNAWKYTRHTVHAHIRVGVEDQGRRTYVVADNGAGFDMKDAGLLFEPFQRLHRHNEFEGSGVGLATVYKIVTRHGGRVWAQAARDQGASFRFTLGTDGTA